MPTPPHVLVGAWEDGRFIGAVVFSRGANNHIGWPYGLSMVEVCELARVALASHATPTSRVVALALRFVRRRCPGLRLVVSYADPNHGHHGGIYQAGGWVYVGDTQPGFKYRAPDGRVWHQRQVSVSGVKPQYHTLRRVPKIAECVKLPERGKHRYLMPMDDAMQRQVTALAQPYPKRAPSRGETPADQAGEGGSTPTRTLQEIG